MYFTKSLFNVSSQRKETKATKCITNIHSMYQRKQVVVQAAQLVM